MFTIAHAIQQSNTLAEADTARLDIELLLAFVLNKDRAYLYTWPERELSLEQQAEFEALLKRRQCGEPMAHIVGEKEFWSLPFKVNDSTLIPRPETELLVECILARYPDTGIRIVDLGTGTGAIICALARERPHWHCLGVEKNKEALELAKINGESLHLSNIQWQLSDWFEQLDSAVLFNVIVSNPPYVDESDLHLLQGDVRFEPASALVAANKGLADLEHIIQHAPHYLYNQGLLLVEHGCQQGQAVAALLDDQGFIDIFTAKDLAGLARVTGGIWQKG
ncbi:MAG: peptide chain release factor N(5)-glutamine methyltransferase [Pseudomonadota bacterium]